MDKLVGLLLAAPAAWWLLRALRDAWAALVAGHPPAVSAGRPWQASGARAQLRQDANARVFADRGGILLQRRFWFVATGTPPLRLAADEYRRRALIQAEDPVLVGEHRDRRFWWYRDEFFWTTDEGYDSRDVKALLFARERRLARRPEHAHAVMAAAGDPSPAGRRRAIPREIRQAVFRRDRGRCVECEGAFDLQYDHVIPLALGGANTVENLQLLCAPCNQRKGDRL